MSFCKFCKREILNKGGLVKHENCCKLNPNRIHYPSNFIKYNDQVKSNLKKGSNQFVKAKSENRIHDISEKTRLKLSKGRKGKQLTDSHKSKLSNSRSKYLEEVGGGGFTNIKWYSIKNLEQVDYIVRGTWELQIARLLNSENVLWIRKIYLKYFDKNEKSRTYTPDFYLPEYDVYVEVKGYFSEADRDKLNRVIVNNRIRLLLITSKNLSDPELIKQIRSGDSKLLYTGDN